MIPFNDPRRERWQRLVSLRPFAPVIEGDKLTAGDIDFLLECEKIACYTLCTCGAQTPTNRHEGGCKWVA